MRRTVVATLMALVLVASPAFAQQVQEKAAGSKSMADGVLAGETLANTKGTGGSFAGGVAGGLFLGLIGTAIAYVAQGPSDIPAAQNAEVQKYGSEYVLGFQQGFAEKSKKKKKHAALLGGLLGTAVSVTVIVSATGGN